MAKRMIVFLLLCSCLILGGCALEEYGSSTLKATILEIYEHSYLVEPVKGSREQKSSDQILVPTKNMDSSLEPEVGDVIKIKYRGGILESYPGQISEVLSIKVVKEAEENAMIPMVMVNGELYLTTGVESDVQARCGMMDGTIGSTVSGTKKPTKDNQSNFGDGYGYQFGSTEGTIEILMDGKWWIYATEDVRESIQFPEKEYWGITLNAVHATTTGMTLECIQSGGEPTGELQTGSWYIVERWTKENGWQEAEYIIDGNIGWTEEAWMIPMEATTVWEIDWKWLYGELPAGKYRIGKEIMDFRGTGDYDTFIYFAEFEI